MLIVFTSSLAWAESDASKEYYTYEDAYNSYEDAISEYLYKVRYEYGYYTEVYHDGSRFPAKRITEIITYIEDNFLNNSDYNNKIFQKYNPLSNVSNIEMAKLFLYYGSTPFIEDDIKSGEPITATPLMEVTIQTEITLEENGRIKKLEYNDDHDKIVEYIHEKRVIFILLCPPIVLLNWQDFILH